MNCQFVQSMAKGLVPLSSTFNGHDHRTRFPGVPILSYPKSWNHRHTANSGRDRKFAKEGHYAIKIYSWVANVKKEKEKAQDFP